MQFLRETAKLILLNEPRSIPTSRHRSENAPRHSIPQEGALEYVEPDKPAGFREEMSGGMPGLPSDYEIILAAPHSGAEEAKASIDGTDLEVDMVLIDGRWWITR